MQIKEILKLEDGESKKLSEMLELFIGGKEKPENIVGYVEELITGAFWIGLEKGKKK